MSASTSASSSSTASSATTASAELSAGSTTSSGTASDVLPRLHWVESSIACSARWHSATGTPPPKRVQVVDDSITADAAFRLVCEGTALLWRGDYHFARQMLQALARRIESKSQAAKKKAPSFRRTPESTSSAAWTPASAGVTVSSCGVASVAMNVNAANAPDAADALAAARETFHLYRQAQAQRARILGQLLIPFGDDYVVELRRAPDVRLACCEAQGRASGPFVGSLRELLGVIGAHEWRKKGVEIPALFDRIHPHYGVFSPIRGEYVGLVAGAPLPSALQEDSLAFDIGTGTGVLAAVLAKRGIARIVATDSEARALACTRDNLARLGFGDRVDLVAADLFPPGRAPLVVCNPPWLPGRAGSSLESAVYDPDSRMLKGFLAGLAAHLSPGGEGWLILSDLAEHLGLRARDELLALIDAAGLRVVARLDVRPRHGKASDPDDPLAFARAAEITSLWRLAAL